MGCLTSLKFLWSSLWAQYICIVLMLKNELNYMWFTCYISAFIQEKSNSNSKMEKFSRNFSSILFPIKYGIVFKDVWKLPHPFSHLSYTMRLTQNVHLCSSKKQIFLCLFSVYVVRVVHRKCNLKFLALALNQMK